MLNLSLESLHHSNECNSTLGRAWVPSNQGNLVELKTIAHPVITHVPDFARHVRVSKMTCMCKFSGEVAALVSSDATRAREGRFSARGFQILVFRASA